MLLPAHLEDSYSLITQETEEKTGSFAAVINPITSKGVNGCPANQSLLSCNIQRQNKSHKIKSKENSLVCYIKMCGFDFPMQSQHICLPVFNLVLKCASI